MALASSLDVFPADASLSASDLALQKVSPIYVVPSASVKAPCWQSRGSEDPLITLESVIAFQDALRTSGWTDDDNQYVEVAGAGHAFYDWKVDAATKETYEQYGEPHLDQMIAFFDKYVAN